MSRSPQYVLCPGMVTSKTDRQFHYIGAMALARLYGVDLKQCEIFEPAAWWPPSFWEMAEQRHKGLVKLTPRRAVTGTTDCHGTQARKGDRNEPSIALDSLSLRGPDDIPCGVLLLHTV